MDKRKPICRAAIWASILICVLGSSSGCTRMFYRRQADAEVNAVLREKDIFPWWKIEQMRFYPDVRARFGDATNPDRPPMPPDDPAARQLGPNPQKPRHAGIARIGGTGYLDLMAEWNALNRDNPSIRARTGMTSYADSLRTVAHVQKKDDQPELIPAPRPVEAAPTVPPNAFMLTIDQAMELAQLNSREFQTRREDLYLTALPVTRERFAFSAQYLALGQIIREGTGADIGAGKGERWQFASTTGVGKLFSTGALLLIGFANQTVIELNNPTTRRVTSNSGINLDLFQPLLRGGGRAATLEPLTQVERNLLYEIRDYARFRKHYFQYMTGGVPLPGIGVTTAGSLASVHPVPSSLASANPVRQQIQPGSPGELFLGVNAKAPAEGYMPTILKAAVLRNEEENLKRLDGLMNRFVAYESGGIMTSLQVGLVELQRLQAKVTVLAREQELRDALDNFKQQLGIPVNTAIHLDDLVIHPNTKHFAAYDAILKDHDATVTALDKLDRPKDLEIARAELVKLLTESPLARKTIIFKSATPASWKQRWNLKNADAIQDQLAKDLKARRELYDRRDDIEKKINVLEKKLKGVDSEAMRSLRKQAEQVAADVTSRSLEITLGDLELAVRQFAAAKPDDQPARWRVVYNIFRYRILAHAGNERFANQRASWTPLPRLVVDGVDLLAEPDLENAYALVTRTAIDNRVDLMNTRAQVVDAWRQLRVFANSLLGTFTVGYHMDGSTPPDGAKPLAFQPTQTRHQLVINGELPLVRLTERNAYRASQIAYQRARRNLDQHEDQIANQVRSEVRLLRVLAQNLKIQQQAVEIAYHQVVSSLEDLGAPPQPPPAAALDPNGITLVVLRAYGGLPVAQNQLLRTWIDYHIVRQQLFLDLELMPLDARGVWLDEFSNNLSERQQQGPEPQSSERPRLGAPAPQPTARVLP